MPFYAYESKVPSVVLAGALSSVRAICKVVESVFIAASREWVFRCYGNLALLRR